MINSKRLVEMARKWQEMASIGRKRISMDMESCSKSAADKGHFVLYTVEGRRFMVPLQYLKNPVFIELFRMSEDTFGLTRNGPITLPCDGVFMEHVISSVRKRRVSKEEQKALIFTITNQQCSLSTLHPHQRHSNQQILILGF